MKKILLILTIFLIASCEGNNGVSDSKSQYLPDSQGSWWISGITSAGGPLSLGTGTDSTVVTGMKNLSGKNASIFTSYTLPSSTGSDMYFVNEGDKLYTLPSSLLPGINFGFPDSITNSWMLIINPDSDYWLIGKYKDLTLALMGFSATGDLEITGQKGESKDFTIEGNKLTADEFIINFDYNGYVIVKGLPAPVKFSADLQLYFTKGVGLVYSDMNGSASSPLANAPITFTRRQELKYYKIN